MTGSGQGTPKPTVCLRKYAVLSPWTVLDITRGGEGWGAGTALPTRSQKFYHQKMCALSWKGSVPSRGHCRLSPGAGSKKAGPAVCLELALSVAPALWASHSRRSITVGRPAGRRVLICPLLQPSTLAVLKCSLLQEADRVPSGQAKGCILLGPTTPCADLELS